VKELNDKEFNMHWEQVAGTAYKFCKKYHISGYNFEDLLQEARMELHSTLVVYDKNKGASLNTYYYHRLRQRLQNLLNMAKAKKNKYNHFEHASFNDELITSLVSDDTESPEQLVLKQEREKELVDMVNAVHPLLRDIIILRFQGHTNAYIAQKYEVSTQTIVTRFRLVRNFLKTRPSIDEIKSFNDEYEQRLKKAGRTWDKKKH